MCYGLERAAESDQPMTSPLRTIVLGGGLSGLSAAYQLGEDAELYERDGAVGGLCRSRLLNGFTFDYVGHLLHFRHPETLRLLRDTFGLDLVYHQRSAWVYSKQTFTRYPFQANTYGLPVEVIKECLLGLADQQRDPTSPPVNFEEWIYRTFGEGIARHFMVPYNLKFWTVPPQTLTCDWLDGYVPVPTFEEALDGALTESQRLLGYNAQFWYPRQGGIQTVAEAFAQRIPHLGLNAPATRIDLRRRTVAFADGREVAFDRLLSSIPLPELGRLLTPVPEDIQAAFARLRYTSVYVLNLGVARERVCDRHWIYFPEPELCFFRVGFPMNFSPAVAPPGHSSLYVEVSHSPHRPLEIATIRERMRRDVVTAGILRADDRIVVEDAVNIKYGYVLFDRDHAAATAAIDRFLEPHGIHGIGRYGRWRYMSMEDSILDGQRAAAAVTLSPSAPPALLPTHA